MEPRGFQPLAAPTVPGGGPAYAVRLLPSAGTLPCPCWPPLSNPAPALATGPIAVPLNMGRRPSCQRAIPRYGGAWQGLGWVQAARSPDRTSSPVTTSNGLLGTTAAAQRLDNPLGGQRPETPRHPPLLVSLGPPAPSHHTPAALEGAPVITAASRHTPCDTSHQDPHPGPRPMTHTRSDRWQATHSGAHDCHVFAQARTADAPRSRPLKRTTPRSPGQQATQCGSKTPILRTPLQASLPSRGGNGRHALNSPRAQQLVASRTLRTGRPKQREKRRPARSQSEVLQLRTRTLGAPHLPHTPFQAC